MAQQLTDFQQIVGKTLVRPYIDGSHQNLIFRFTDETWFNMAAARDLDIPIYFDHITNHQFLFDATILSFIIIDVLDVSITTNKGTTTFNSLLFQPSYTNGQLDVYQVSDVEDYDDNSVTRITTLALDSINGNEVKETVYELLTYDF